MAGHLTRPSEEYVQSLLKDSEIFGTETAQTIQIY